MSFKVLSLATIRMSVSNIQEARDWCAAYFAAAPMEDTENFVSFQVGKIKLDLCLADEKSPVSNGGTVAYWLVDDLERAMTRAKSLGATIYRGPLRVDEINRTIVQIKTPFGHIFGLEA